MTEYCKDCYPGLTNICDFCKFFYQNNPHNDKGICRLTNEERELYERCDRFICRFLERQANNGTVP